MINQSSKVFVWDITKCSILNKEFFHNLYLKLVLPDEPDPDDTEDNTDRGDRQELRLDDITEFKPKVIKEFRLYKKENVVWPTI